ncbi:MAG TPA: hypothetical protein GXZ59_01490 [Clostridiaceae bacterium]|nr:hypothetical protein [Clostridiaceae bacterium]
MDSKELQEIIAVFRKSGLAKMTLETADCKLTLEASKPALSLQVPADIDSSVPGEKDRPKNCSAPFTAHGIIANGTSIRSVAAAASSGLDLINADPSAEDTSGISAAQEDQAHTTVLTEVRAPLVGVFYQAPEEGAEPYVNVGDTVKKGQTLFILEAMKMLNYIDSPCDGIIHSIKAENAAMVEFDQLIMEIQSSNQPESQPDTQ